MDRWDWMWVKVMATSATILVVGTGVALALKSASSAVTLAGQPVFGALAPLAPWVWGASAALATFFLADRFYRVWRFERGKGPICRFCDGPLGMERQARWSAVLQCMLCGRTNGEAHYRRS